LNSFSQMLHNVAAYSPREASFGAGITVALALNLMNNLPTGLVAATVGQSADVPLQVTSGILIGVDLGPNLSVTGFARDNTVANRPEAGRRSCDSVAVPETWNYRLPPALVIALLAITAVS
jgi:arsenical pump membrane protein